MAEIIAVLGPPPREMLLNNDYATEFFDSEGTLSLVNTLHTLLLIKQFKAIGRERLLFHQLP